MKILPSPMRPVFADDRIVSTTLSHLSSGTTTSIFTLGRKSIVYSLPLYSSVCPFCRPNPLTSLTVRPWIPTSARALFTSSSLKGLMIASIFFIRHPPSLTSLKAFASRSGVSHPRSRHHCQSLHPCLTEQIVCQNAWYIKSSAIAPSACQTPQPLDLSSYFPAC